MTGNRTGIATQLRQENPKLISVHCIAHRLALATKDVFKDVPYLSSYEDILSNVLHIHHNSGVRSAGLKEIQQILDSPVLKMKEAKHVRYIFLNRLQFSYSDFICDFDVCCSHFITFLCDRFFIRS